MRSQNALLAWLTIVLSLVLLTYTLASFEISPHGPDMRPLLVFLFLAPIGIAVFLLNGAESLFVGITSAVLCVVVVCLPQYAAIPFTMWHNSFYEYVLYLTKPLFSSGIIWQLVTFIILSYWAGYLAWHLRDKYAQSQALVIEKEGLYSQLADERNRLLRQHEKYGKDINRLGSLLMVLSDLARDIPSVLEVDGLLKLVMDKAVELFLAKQGAIFHVDRAQNNLVLACSVGYNAKALAVLKQTADEGSGMPGWCAKNGKSLALKDVQSDPYLTDLLRQNRFSVTFCQPIPQMGTKEQIAVLCLGEIGREMEQRELIRLSSFLGNITSIAIQNAKLMQKAKEQAVRDGLTGLYNHRYFYELLQERLKTAKQKAMVLGVLLIDVDYFKKFNDTYGHQTGDLILQKTSEIMKGHIQKEDISARYGGEEFAIICIRQDAEPIRALAEELRVVTERTRFEDGDNIKITISIGAAFYDPDTLEQLSTAELVKRADEALYSAKEGGRNQVRVYKQGSRLRLGSREKDGDI